MALKIDITMTGMGRTLAACGQWSRQAEGAVQRAVNRSANYLRKQWIMGIRSQAPGGQRFKPLSPVTIALKKSSKALIDHGDMIRSINVQRIMAGRQIVFFVGINRNAVTRDGSNMANLAEIHETGSLKVKDRPPARPHMLPSWRVYVLTAQQQFANDVAQSLGLMGSMRIQIGATAEGETG
jgi:hypothetical protein